MTREYKTTKDLCKTIREGLKAELPGCKFSVIGDNYSMGRSITVALMEGSFKAFKEETDRPYAQLNHYQFIRPGWGQDGMNNGTILTPECWAIMKKAAEIGLKEHWDDSDLQSDYYSSNFHFNLEIGKWNKPYKQTEAI